MILNFVLLAAVGVLIAAGVYLFLDRALTRMLMGLLLMGNGINLLILLGSDGPGSPPIWGRNVLGGGQEADSLPQAFILTAIVISMGMTGFLLALAYRQHRYRIGDHVQDDREDRTLALRRLDDPSAAPDHDRSDDPTTGLPTQAGDQFGPVSFEKPIESDSAAAKKGDGDDD
ncbi:Na(+)/H(+) antiporter subunit C [Corynebacterium lactis]|uniref:Cation:proton antiporter n=1 Tax=Corynebacterium lactis RW2-5 TaxID=1408189 RepID=A0A0K2H312_9CORY|nr:Na(+)/H(+) antiporter subunit C [Corynebacterium lactis]ALA68106.1 cation:proton antiporter [Corynebacterium lactis RW2-5]